MPLPDIGVRVVIPKDGPWRVPSEAGVVLVVDTPYLIALIDPEDLSNINEEPVMAVDSAFDPQVMRALEGDLEIVAFNKEATQPLKLGLMDRQVVIEAIQAVAVSALPRPRGATHRR